MRPLGDRAFLIGVADPKAARALATALAEPTGWPAASARGGLRLRHGHGRRACRSRRWTLAAARRRRASASAAGAVRPRARRPTGPRGHRSVRVRRARSRRGGRARRLCTEDEVVALLTAATLTVAVMGFSPGFAYLDGLPAAVGGRRRGGTARVRSVPAGSVALANGHAAVYPTASPGGWQLVGRTAFPLLLADRAALRRARPGRRRAVHRGRAGRARRARAGRSAGLAAGRRGPARARDRGARAARRAPGRRAPRGGRHRRPRGRARPTRTPSCWPTGWWATATERRALEITAGGTRLRCLSGRVTSRWSAARPMSGSTAPRCRPARCVPLARGQRARDRAPARRAAHLPGAWPAACADPSCSPAWPATS